MTNNENGPAEAATSPSHGSTNPTKEKEMNSTEHSTTVAILPALSRRRFLGGVAITAIPSAAIANTVVQYDSEQMTAQERFDFHLCELKTAAQELDPMIGHWTICDINRNSEGGCSLLISAFRVTGRYAGDGMYEAGKQTWNGSRVEWRVKALAEHIDGERLFDVSCPGEKKMQLVESRLNTFIGRRLS